MRYRRNFLRLYASPTRLHLGPIEPEIPFLSCRSRIAALPAAVAIRTVSRAHAPTPPAPRFPGSVNAHWRSGLLAPGCAGVRACWRSGLLAPGCAGVRACWRSGLLALGFAAARGRWRRARCLLGPPRSAVVRPVRTDLGLPPAPRGGRVALTSSGWGRLRQDGGGPAAQVGSGLGLRPICSYLPLAAAGAAASSDALGLSRSGLPGWSDGTGLARADLPSWWVASLWRLPAAVMLAGLALAGLPSWWVASLWRLPAAAMLAGLARAGPTGMLAARATPTTPQPASPQPASPQPASPQSASPPTTPSARTGWWEHRSVPGPRAESSPKRRKRYRTVGTAY
jgi:hypothetical protein